MSHIYFTLNHLSVQLALPSTYIRNLTTFFFFFYCFKGISAQEQWFSIVAEHEYFLEGFLQRRLLGLTNL